MEFCIDGLQFQDELYVWNLCWGDRSVLLAIQGLERCKIAWEGYWIWFMQKQALQQRGLSVTWCENDTVGELHHKLYYVVISIWLTYLSLESWWNPSWSKQGSAKLLSNNDVKVNHECPTKLPSGIYYSLWVWPAVWIRKWCVFDLLNLVRRYLNKLTVFRTVKPIWVM